MSIAHNFADQNHPDHGFASNRTQRIFSGPPEPDDLMSEALAEDVLAASDAEDDKLNASLAEDLSNMAVDEGTFKSAAEQQAWEAQEIAARRRYHEDRAKAAHDAASKAPMSLIDTKRELYRQNIAHGKAAITVQQATAAEAMEHIRQLKILLRVDEDALDSLLASEA